MSLLILRLIVGIVFLYTGWSYLKKPVEVSRSIEMSISFTYLLGLGNSIGGFLILTGIFVKPAAALLILILCGSILFKVLRWKINFFDNQMPGWSYDIVLLAFNLVLLAFGSGHYRLIY